MKKVVPLLMIALLSGCANPSDGPSAGSIQSAKFPHSADRIPVIELASASSATAANPVALSNPSDAGLAGLRGGAFNQQRLRPGDVIDVTVLDTGEDGLFSSTQSKTLNLGRFTVDQNGNVTMPFVGKQRVTDSTPEGLQSRIVAGLKGSSVNPQAVVTVVDKPSSVVVVSGGVKNPGKFPITAQRERVLDVISQAGGASAAPTAAVVTVVRGNQRASAKLERIMNDAKQNIRLVPGDQVMVDDEAVSFTALGAFKNTGEFPFEPGKLTLAQALGRAGGLADDRADARNVYIFRNQIVQASVASSPSTKPVIYHVNMKDPSSIMLMQLFQMQKGDVIYATTASTVNAAKLFTVYDKPSIGSVAPAPGSK